MITVAQACPTMLCIPLVKVRYMCEYFVVHYDLVPLGFEFQSADPDSIAITSAIDVTREHSMIFTSHALGHLVVRMSTIGTHYALSRHCR